MVSATTVRRMPLAELETRGEWQVLTPKQRVFLQAYLSNNYDAAAAVRAAYGTTVEKNAKIFSYEILSSPRIDRVLALHFGWSEQDQAKIRRQKSVKKLLRMVRFQLRHAEPGSTGAQRLTSQWQSLLLGNLPETDDEPDGEPAPAPAPQAASKSPTAGTPAPVRAAAPAVLPPPKPFIGQIVPRRRPDGTSRDVLIVDIDPITGRTQSIDVPTDLSNEQRAALTANVGATAARASALPLVPEPPIARVSTPVATAVPTPKPANPPVVTEGMSGDEIRAAVLRAAENETLQPTPGTAAWVQQQVDLLHAKPPVAINTEVRGTEAWIIREMEILKGQS